MGPSKWRNKATSFYLCEPNPCTHMPSESSHYRELHASHLTINIEGTLFHYTQHKEDIWFPCSTVPRGYSSLQCFSEGQKKPIYYMLSKKSYENNTLFLKHIKSSKCTKGEGFLTYPTSMLIYKQHSFILALQFPLHSAHFGQFSYWLWLAIMNSAWET
jgi:hypothetical protein